MEFYVENSEDLQRCPYDDTHMIRYKKMPYHLQKCRLNHRGASHMTCPFNALHEMPHQEYRYHLQNCEDRFMIQQDTVSRVTNSKTGNSGDTSLPKYKDIDYSDGEDWDNDEHDAPSFSYVQQCYSFGNTENSCSERIQFKSKPDNPSQNFNRPKPNVDEYIRPPRTNFTHYRNQMKPKHDEDHIALGRSRLLSVSSKNSSEVHQNGFKNGHIEAHTSENEVEMIRITDRNQEKMKKSTAELVKIAWGRGRGRGSQPISTVGEFSELCHNPSSVSATLEDDVDKFADCN